MPWVRLDDRFPSHRKVALLSDRAFRLYVSALCWSSEQLTEGRILDRELPVIARLRGAKAAAQELESAGLWDRADRGWVIHDYLEYNPDRARVQADRAANAARQQAYRERRKAVRNAARNAPSNGVTRESETAPDDTNATASRHERDANPREIDRANQPSSQVNEIRNGASNGTPSPPPSHASPTEKHASKNAPPVGPQIPAFAADLVEQMTAAGMVVGWRLGETEWFALHDRIKRVGVPALVEQARRRWNPADPPLTARYLTRIWADLPDMPAPSDGPRLRAVDDPPLTRAQQTAEWYRQAAQKGQ